MHERQSERSLSKAELRQCKGLSRHQLRRNKKCEAALKRERAATAEKRRPAKTMSKAELRRCRAMSYRQLLRHRDCADLLQSELNEGKHAKHGSRHKSVGKHKASSKPRKAARHHKKRDRD